MLATMLRCCIGQMNNFRIVNKIVDKCIVMPVLSTALYLDSLKKHFDPLFSVDGAPVHWQGMPLAPILTRYAKTRREVVFVCQCCDARWNT
jgi:hypothetical protein